MDTKTLASYFTAVNEGGWETVAENFDCGMCDKYKFDKT